MRFLKASYLPTLACLLMIITSVRDLTAVWCLRMNPFLATLLLLNGRNVPNVSFHLSSFLNFPALARISSNDLAHPLNTTQAPIKSDSFHLRLSWSNPASISASICRPSFTQMISRAQHLACIAAAIIQDVRSSLHVWICAMTPPDFHLLHCH